MTEYVVGWTDFYGHSKKTFSSFENAKQFANELKRNGFKNVDIIRLKNFGIFGA